MKVTIKESSLVLPSENTPKQRLWLSNLDIMFPPFYVLAAYVYKSEGSPNFMDTEVLKESLSKVLVTFYPLAGRLVVDENGRREVDCNGEGVLFVKAEADCPLGDYADFAAFRDVLFPAIDPERHFSSYPLVLLQVTRFSCGGVFMGVLMHHNVVDGEGGTHFIHSWSEVTRGQPISVQPVFDRSFLRSREPPNPKFHLVESDPPPATEKDNGPYPIPSLIKIPVDLINVLKSKVNKESKQVKYSTFEILTAHLWRCGTKARNFSADQEAILTIPINCRDRLNPSLPKGYSGNVIFYATTEVSTGELLSESLIKTLERIRKAIKQINNDYLRSAIDYMEKKNNDSNQLLQHEQKYQPLQIRQGSFFVNNWATMHIFNANYGWGRPINMLPPLLLDGMATFLPRFQGENDLPLVISLQEEHMKSFETLLYVLEVTSKL